MSAGQVDAAASARASDASASSSRPFAGPACASVASGATTTSPVAIAKTIESARARFTVDQHGARRAVRATVTASGPRALRPREDPIVPKQHFDRAGPTIERVVVRAGQVLEIVVDPSRAPRGGGALDRALEVVIL